MIPSYVARPRAPTLSWGRDLFDCSPDQFSKFTGASGFIPTVAQIEKAMERFNLKCVENTSRLWVVTDSEGVAKSPMARSKRSALDAWWRETGLELVIKIRQEERGWLEFQGRGRRGSPEAISERTAMRSEQYQKVAAVCREVMQVMEEAYPAVVPWLKFCMSGDIIRPNTLRKVGERRFTVETCAALYDVYNFWPEWGSAIEGKDFDFEACQAEVAEWVKKLGEVNNAAYLIPLVAVNTTLTGCADANHLISRVRRVLELNEISGRQELRKICETALL